MPRDRFGLLSRALLPASALDDWMLHGPVAVDGLWRLTAADQQQEAQAIALVLRDALETPGAAGRAGDARSQSGWARGRRVVALRNCRRRQRGGTVSRVAACRVLAPAGARRGRGIGARAAFGAAEAPSLRSGHESDCLPAGGPDTGDAVSAWPSPDAGHKRVAADRGQGSGTSLFDGRVFVALGSVSGTGSAI